jgi:ATP-dependent 26S proteasome regulatory subunit
MNNLKPIQLLDNYIRARYPIIVIISHEETRVMSEIKTLASNKNRRAALIEWTYTQGLIVATTEGGRKIANTEDPSAALDQIISGKLASNDPTIYIMRDIHPMLNDAKIIRQLRDVAAAFETTKNNLILISPSMQIPADLEKTVALIDWPLPDSNELSAILKTCEISLPEKVKVSLNGSREQVVQSLQGLTTFEASSVLLSAVVATHELGVSAIPHIIKEKAQIIRKSGVLEFFDTAITMQNVGGLNHLKQYASIKRMAFSEKAKAEGVDTPKGVLLVGVPGTGKSLSAKAIAGGQMPLLRMDIGALMGGLVGQSESNMRSALKVAEAVAPCVLWVDEIEKALASGGDLDGGTSSRVFGTLLTWMQETTAPVYVIATANNAHTIKPELLRRFDDIFWVDLPNAESRREIFTIHLIKRNHSVSLITDELLSATWGFSGAEIEKVVKSAVEFAFFESVALNNDHLVSHARAIVPVSRTMAEQINHSREWARDRARNAGDPLEPEPQYKVQSARMVEI